MCLFLLKMKVRFTIILSEIWSLLSVIFFETFYMLADITLFTLCNGFCVAMSTLGLFVLRYYPMFVAIVANVMQNILCSAVHSLQRWFAILHDICSGNISAKLQHIYWITATNFMQLPCVVD